MKAMSVDSVSVWDEKAALQSCWMDCEAFPTSAYRSTNSIPHQNPILSTPIMCVFSNTSYKHTVKSQLCCIFLKAILVWGTYSFDFPASGGYPSDAFVFYALGTQVMTMTFSTFPATLTKQPALSGNHHRQNDSNNHNVQV